MSDLRSWLLCNVGNHTGFWGCRVEMRGAVSSNDLTTRYVCGDCGAPVRAYRYCRFKKGFRRIPLTEINISEPPRRVLEPPTPGARYGTWDE